MKRFSKLPPSRRQKQSKDSSGQQLKNRWNKLLNASCRTWPLRRSKQKSYASHKPHEKDRHRLGRLRLRSVDAASAQTYPFLLFFALLRLAAVNAFTRAPFFRCFFLVLRSFSRPVAIVSPNCKKVEADRAPRPRLCRVCIAHGSTPLKLRMMQKLSSGVLASLKASTYGPRYASAFRSLRPCWMAFPSFSMTA